MIRCIHGQPAGCYQCDLENRQDFTQLFHPSSTTPATSPRSRKSRHKIRTFPVNDRRRHPGCQVVLAWLSLSLVLGWLAQARLGLLAMAHPVVVLTLSYERRIFLYYLYLIGLAFAAHAHPLAFPWPDLLAGVPPWLLYSWWRWDRSAPYREEQKWEAQMRQTAYLPAELEWARARPAQTLDLMLVVEESPAVSDALPSIRFDLEELLLALQTTSHSLRVGLATYGTHARILPLDSDRESVLAAIRGLGAQAENEPGGNAWDEVVTASWRAAAQRVVCWIGSAPPAGQDDAVFSQTCVEKGIVVHALACRPEPASGAEVFARVASKTGGQSLALSDAWLLLPLLVAPPDGPERQALSDYVTEEWHLQIRELQWQEQVDRLAPEGYKRIWVHAGSTTLIEASHRWPGVKGLTPFEALRPDGTLFQFEAEVGEARYYATMTREFMQQYGLHEHEQLLLRPRGFTAPEGAK